MGEHWLTWVRTVPASMRPFNVQHSTFALCTEHPFSTATLVASPSPARSRFHTQVLRFALFLLLRLPRR